MDWTVEILDVFSTRGYSIFTNWHPAALRQFAQTWSTKSWDAIIVRNLVAAPNFKRDLVRWIASSARSVESKHASITRKARGRLRGKPDVRATVTQRLRTGEKTSWVVRTKTKGWQSEINGAVAGFFDFLLRSCKEYSVESGVESSVFLGLHRLLNSEPLKHVAPSFGWRNVYFDPRLLAKSTFYRTVHAYMYEVRKAETERSMEGLRSHIGGWLKAQEDERLFELYALSVTLSVLHAARTWNRFAIVADFERGLVQAETDDTLVSVFFDRRLHGPRDVYSEIIAKYGALSGGSRRPDLHIVVRTPVRSRLLLIEAKHTWPSSDYARDSIFKVLGYLANYDDRWSVDEKPRAFLLFAGPVNPLPSAANRLREDAILIVGPDNFREDLRVVLDNILTHEEDSARPAY